MATGFYPGDPAEVSVKDERRALLYPVYGSHLLSVIRTEQRRLSSSLATTDWVGAAPLLVEAFPHLRRLGGAALPFEARAQTGKRPAVVRELLHVFSKRRF